MKPTSTTSFRVSVRSFYNSYSAPVVNVKVIKDKSSGLPAGTSSQILNIRIWIYRVRYPRHCEASPEHAQRISYPRDIKVTPIHPFFRNFKLNWASYGSTTQKLLGPQATPAPTTPLQEYSVYVSDLDSNVNDAILFQTFARKYNSVISAKVVTDPLNKASKGYGFIKFTDHQESQKAISEMNGVNLFGKGMKLR